MTTHEPIMLSPEEHEFVKANLAVLLAKEYSITNQSAGKLEYLTAALMGFTNHQQRKSMCSTSTPAKPIHAPTVWPEGWMRELDGEMTTNDRNTLSKRGWFCWQNTGEYEDHEFEVTYNTTIDEVRHSFNAVLTFCHTSKSAYIVLGDNFGDGFNSCIEIPLPSTELMQRRTIINRVSETLKKEENKDSGLAVFCQNFLNYTIAADGIISEIIVIMAWCSPPTIAGSAIAISGCSEMVTPGFLSEKFLDN